MKRVLCWIGGIVLVLAAVLAIVISQLDTEFISGQISAAVEKATGTPVRFASPPELSLLPPGAKFTAVSWDGVQDGQGMRFTAKGGVVIAVSNTLKIPVKFVGVGEQMDDLMAFDARRYRS